MEKDVPVKTEPSVKETNISVEAVNTEVCVQSAARTDATAVASVHSWIAAYQTVPPPTSMTDIVSSALPGMTREELTYIRKRVLMEEIKRRQ